MIIKFCINILIGYFYFLPSVFGSSYGIVLPSQHNLGQHQFTHYQSINMCFTKSGLSRHSIKLLRNIPSVIILEAITVNQVKTLQRCLSVIGHIVPERKYRITPGFYLAQSLNDPDLANQWYLHNPTGEDAHILRGWAYLMATNSLGTQIYPNHQIAIAVIDTGICSNHSDLTNIIEHNVNEISDNNIDDDANGYADDLIGWNFVTNTPVPEDDHGHGTHVSGIIAAEASNHIGIAGISAAARIIAIKAFDASGEAGSATLVKAIDYAITRHARIINVSWGQYEPDPLLEAAIKAASDNNILIVAAAGNDATNTDEKPHWPSGYSFPGIISVGAIDRNGNIAGYSNFGKQTVDVFAPGSDIYSTYLDNQFAGKSGTSMAAPMVSGIAATLLGIDPTLNISEVKNKVLYSASLIKRQFRDLIGKCRTSGVPSLVAALGGSMDESYDKECPTSPTTLNGISDAHFETRLSWLPAFDNISVSNYWVSRNGLAPTQTACCEFHDTTTTEGTTYTYSVYAVDWAGNASPAVTTDITTPLFGAPNAWSAFPAVIETPHPYPLATTLTYEVSVPHSYRATKMRLHFSQFNTEEWFDKMNIIDANGRVIATYMGELGSFTSSEINGSHAKIILISDKRNARFGFVIDRIEAFLQ